ncbi:3-hydroxyisobutyryl-CoA hydrolase-like protein mitochondrial-like [Melia azedarach]|uniref:3-hydroxyisobutyryl-CoA hydrolase-like protein mitochondrial-like n=1 Tax=Melia azedarach TaxID=155640 RepID=A0ACC1XPS1_MELAZ|nr:3-hydroxyisobutyryl-CoA hydrolase-like protein mitochondrial-like [Melia azedarach]
MTVQAVSGKISDNFCKGVRARLVEISFAPKGNPPCLEQVTKDMVNAYFERLSLGEPDLKSYPTTSFVNSPMPLLYKHIYAMISTPSPLLPSEILTQKLDQQPVQFGYFGMGRILIMIDCNDTMLHKYVLFLMGQFFYKSKCGVTMNTRQPGRLGRCLTRTWSYWDGKEVKFGISTVLIP